MYARENVALEIRFYDMQYTRCHRKELDFVTIPQLFTYRARS